MIKEKNGFYKHVAYNDATGEVVSCPSAKYLKRMVNVIAKSARPFKCSWRFCHNYGTKFINKEADCNVQSNNNE